MTRVFVDGQEGTTGLRIREVLAGRDDIDVLSIDPAKRKDPAERAALLNAADVAFLCLPDDAAREAVAMVQNPIPDRRLRRPDLPDRVFGLPELPGSTGAPAATPIRRHATPSSCWCGR
jgi:N-acetyl-gamma-glutamyl-phosphate reductase